MVAEYMANPDPVFHVLITGVRTQPVVYHLEVRAPTRSAAEVTALDQVRQLTNDNREPRTLSEGEQRLFIGEATATQVPNVPDA